MSDNNDIKQKILHELSNESMDDTTLKELFQHDPNTDLNAEFTRSVMQKVKAAKKPSPIIRLTRIALPITACAAAIAIFVTVGMRDADNPPFKDGISTIHNSSDEAVCSPTDPNDSFDDCEYALSGEEIEQPAEESDNIKEVTVQEPAGKDPEADADAEKIYPSSSTVDAVYTEITDTAKSKTTAFAPAKNSEAEKKGEITLRISEPYYGKAILGYEVCISSDNREYEIIITADKEISKDELIYQIEEYVNALNSYGGTDNGQIEILSEELPDTLESKSIIKIIRTK